MKIIYVALLLLLIQGCAQTLSVSQYRIKTDTKYEIKHNRGCKTKSLKVIKAYSNNFLSTQKMQYSNEDNTQYFYSQSRWSESPNIAITSEFVRMLRESQLYKSIQISRSMSLNSEILEIDIEDFTQYFKSNSSYVNLIIKLTIIDSSNKHILTTKLFSYKMKSPSLDAKGGAEALNETLNKLLLDSGAWFSRVCE